MRLALEMAEAFNAPVPAAMHAQNLMREGRSMGFGADDVTSIARVLETVMGCKLSR
jgi:3-hydroxyisobutyrate dehydrogenase-like beta-hydroxyacid dehydrogenase